MPFEAKGVLYAVGPPRKLPPAWLVLHRQTSAHERRKGTLDVQLRSGVIANFYPASLAVANGRALHCRPAPRGG